MRSQTVLRALVLAVAVSTDLNACLCTDDISPSQGRYLKEKCRRRDRQARKFEAYLGRHFQGADSQVAMQPVWTADSLPRDRQRVLWWHPKHECWYLGTYYYSTVPRRYEPGYFISGDATWYVCQGQIVWSPEPPRPLSCEAVGRLDHICCIHQTHAEKTTLSWCGRKIEPFEFVFVSIDHATYSNLAGDCLVPCPECVEAIVAALREQQTS